MVTVLQYMTLISLSCSMISCATTQEFTVQNEPSEFSSDVHVHQTNGIDVLTELDRDYWLQTRKSTSKEQLRLYSALGLREWDVAIADARIHLETHPGDYVALSVLSTALAMKQNFNLASYYAKLIDKLYPGQAESKNIMGLAILNRPGATYQDIQEAAQKFESAFESDEKQIASGLNLGHLHLQTGNSQSAREVFEQVRKRCGNCTASLYGSGLAASRLKDFKFAKQTFKKILDRDPKNAQAKYYLALVENFGFHKPKEAVAILAELLEERMEQPSDNLDILRQANFLKRRIEAQIYAQKYRGGPHFQEQVSNEVFATTTDSASAPDNIESTEQDKQDSTPEESAITPASDSTEEYDLESP